MYPKNHQELAKVAVKVHIFSLVRTLFQVGIDQLQGAASTVSESASRNSPKTLSGLVTAPLRRMLPAIHITSRWLRMHVDSYAKATNPEGEERRELDETINEFWLVFADFSTRLSRMFALDQLPKDEVALEEDVDLRGFLPLETDAAGRHSRNMRDLSEVHPNDEHLMRIRDFQRDALYLVSTLR